MNVPLNIDLPAAKEVSGKWLDEITSGVANHPSVSAYGLCNELWWSDNADYDSSDFQSFVRGRYDGDISKLNRLWETNFSSFDTVTFVPKTRAAREDMGRYSAFRITRWWKWNCARLNKDDHNRPGYVKVHGAWWSVSGVDPDGLSDAMSANSADCYPNYGKTRLASAGAYNQDQRCAADFWTQAIILDTYRSLQPNKPIIDSEYHVIPYGGQYGVDNVPAEYVSSMFWQGALHGRDAAFMWVGQRRGVHPWVDYECDDFFLLTEPWALDAAGRTALDTERLAKYILAFQHGKSHVAFLRSGMDFPEWYKQMYFQDCRLDLITPTSIEQGKLRKYRVLVAPENATLSAKAVKMVAKFVRAGGRLVAGPGAMTFDEKDQPNDLSALHNKITRVGGVGLDTQIDHALDRSGIIRPVRSRAKHVEMRIARVDGRRIVYAINFDPKPQAVRFGGNGVDLISGRRVGGKLEMKSMEVAMVKMD